MADHQVSTEDKGDIRAHQRTFNGFVHFLIWLFGLSALALIFMVLANA